MERGEKRTRPLTAACDMEQCYCHIPFGGNPSNAFPLRYMLYGREREHQVALCEPDVSSQLDIIYPCVTTSKALYALNNKHLMKQTLLTMQVEQGFFYLYFTHTRKIYDTFKKAGSALL